MFDVCSANGNVLGSFNSIERATIALAYWNQATFVSHKGQVVARKTEKKAA